MRRTILKSSAVIWCGHLRFREREARERQQVIPYHARVATQDTRRRYLRQSLYTQVIRISCFTIKSCPVPYHARLATQGTRVQEQRRYLVQALAVSGD